LLDAASIANFQAAGGTPTSARERMPPRLNDLIRAAQTYALRQLFANAAIAASRVGS
jgi:hypothetical protein